MIRSANRRAVNWLDSTLYPDQNDNWDNDMFRVLVQRYLDPSHTLVDLGAGRGALPHMNFKDDVAKAIGVDPDPVVETNPFLHEAHVAVSEDMSCLPDDSVDLVVCNNVLEHVPDADATFSEVHRILRRGGLFIAKTPNLHHYMATVARITPTSFHKYAMKLRGRPVEDTFPTTYPVNTVDTQRAVADRCGFMTESIETVEGRPEYLRFSAPTYVVGAAYERTVNKFGLDGLKVVIFSVFRKP